MTNKEFKRLKRADLIEIIYKMQENEDKYRQELKALHAELDDRQIKLENAGSIAEAALLISDVFSSAQAAADVYLCEAQRLRDEAARELDEARRKAQSIVDSAYDSVSK